MNEWPNGEMNEGSMEDLGIEIASQLFVSFILFYTEAADFKRLLSILQVFCGLTDEAE